MKRESNSEGFSLVECVIAMVITFIAMTGIYSLLVISLKVQVMARNTATANSLARAKIEELRNTATAAGGSLTTDVAGYNDSPSTSFGRRWQVTADAMGTKTVTVTTIPRQPGALLPQVQLKTRIK